MPLSKRITNLHINSSSWPMQSDNDVTDYNMNVNQQQQTDHRNSSHFQSHQHQFAYNQSNEPNQFRDFSSSIHPNDEQERQLQYHKYLNECNNASSNGSSCTNVSNGSDNNNLVVVPYDPELSQEENPFYYNKNKLLYDLYVERMRRHQWL